MRYFFLSAMLLFFTMVSWAELKDYQVYKNTKYKFEFSYPKDCQVTYGDAGDIQDGVKIEEAPSLAIIDATENSTNKCRLGLDMFQAETTKEGYKKAQKNVEDLYKNPPVKVRGPNRIAMEDLNGNKLEIVLDVQSKIEKRLRVSLFIYCENSLRVFGFGAVIKDDGKNNLLKSKPLTINSVFSKEHQAIIKSFRCPPPLNNK